MLQEAFNNPGPFQNGTATVVQIGEVKYTHQGKPYQIVMLQDGQAAAKVRIYQGNASPLTTAHLNQTLNFQVQGYVAKHDNKTYLSGFWKPNKQTIGNGAQQAMANIPQPAAQAQAATRIDSRAQEAAERKVQEQERQASIMRQCAGKCASWLAASGKVPFAARFSEADLWTAYFEKGNPGLWESPTGEPPVAEKADSEDDIPF